MYRAHNTGMRGERNPDPGHYRQVQRPQKRERAAAGRRRRGRSNLYHSLRASKLLLAQQVRRSSSHPDSTQREKQGQGSGAAAHMPTHFFLNRKTLRNTVCVCVCMYVYVNNLPSRKLVLFFIDMGKIEKCHSFRTT